MADRVPKEPVGTMATEPVRRLQGWAANAYNVGIGMGVAQPVGRLVQQRVGPKMEWHKERGQSDWWCPDDDTEDSEGTVGV